MNCINFQKPYIGFQKNYIAPIVNHRLSQSAYQVISEVVKIIAAKIFLDFLSKVVIGGNQSLIGVRHALRRKCSDQVVVKECVGINSSSTQVIFSCRSTHGRGLDSLGHSIGDAVTRRGRAIDETWRTLSIFSPARALLQIREGVPRV